MKLGKRSKVVSYLALSALLGVVLLSVPNLVSPIAEKTFTRSPNTETSVGANGTNTTTTPNALMINRFKLTSENQSIGIYVPSNTTVYVQSSYPANFTIARYTGGVDAVTITSSAPANVTVAAKPTVASASAAPITSNIPDFAMRLALVLVPALVLSSLGLVRERRRVRSELESDSN